MLIVTCSGIRLGRKIEVIEENRCFCWWRRHRQEKLLWHTFNKFNFLHTQFGSVYLDTARHPSVNPALVQLARDNPPKPFETWTRARASQSPCSSPFSLLSILKFKCTQSHTLLPSHCYSLLSKSLLSIFNRTNWVDLDLNLGIKCKQHQREFKNWLPVQSSNVWCRAQLK